MDDLLQSQIRASCRLALPEGLKDLMWDISREVLRAQPKDLYVFITEYLSALMVVRENLRVAAHVCDTMCEDVCHLKLEDQFKKLGLNTEEAVKTAELVKDYFEKRPVVNECNLITKLMNETELEEHFLPQIQSVLRDAFLQHHACGAAAASESSSNSEMDDVSRATRHTLHLYKQCKPTHEEYVRAAITIQGAYRAYKVRRHARIRDRVSKEYRLTIESEHFADFYAVERVEQQNEPEPLRIVESTESAHTHNEKPYMSTASSTSLAGSFLRLPKHKPYTEHLKEVIYGPEELPEREHATIDYTQEHPHRVFANQSNDDRFEERETKRTIKFHEETVEVTENKDENDEDSHDESIEEVHEIHDMRGSSNETD